MRKLILPLLLVFSIFIEPIQAQTNKPTWTVNPAAFEYNMDVTIQVFFGANAVTSGGMIGAFIDGTLQGVKDGGANGPTGLYVFITRVYGSTASGKTITFKFYDTTRDKVYDITETVAFTADGVVGNAVSPQLFHCILGTDATLSDLKVSGTTVTGFSPATLTYNVELPHGTTVVPAVTATTTDALATKVITPAGSLPGATTVVVTAENGTTQQTYTVNFTIAKNNVATLSDLKVDGTTITGFNSATITYNVVLPHATTVVPTVTATTTDANATKVVHAAPSLPGSTTVVVTAENGTTTKTYTINFSLAPDTDATLSDLKVNGTTVTGFASGTITYNVVLPHNTTTVPTITATTHDPNATKVITQALTVTGSGTVVVTAEDGTTTKTYTINFSVAPDTDATLSDLKINGTTVSGFASGTITYNVVLPFGTIVVPTVTATTNDPNATKVITPAPALPGSTTVVVTAEDATTHKTYTINFSLGLNNDATLSDLKVNGTTVTGFNAATLTYNVVLPHNTTVVPTVTATTTDGNATKVITPAVALPGTTTVVVTAQDGTTRKTYSIVFSITPDTDATLSDLKVNGTTVAGFDPATLIYNVVLPHNTTVVPTVTATTTDPNATKVITPAAALPGSTTVVVTAEDGTTRKTYTINFTVAKDTNANLSELKYNSINVLGFQPTTLNYNVVLPFGTTAIPVVTATTADPNATKVITQAASVSGTATVVVTAEDGITTKTYSIVFSVAPPSSDATLSDLKYNGISVTGFVPGTTTYNIELPYGTTAMPVITATTTHASATKIITNPVALPGSGTVQVTAENGTTVSTYTLNFTVMFKSNDATLKDLTLNNTTIQGFNPATLEYNHVLPYGSTNIPTVNGVTNHAQATKVVVQANTIPGTATIEVTAENGIDKKTYRVNFTIGLNTDATLQDLRYTTIPIPGFSPGILSYTVTLPFSTTAMPDVTATATDAHASLQITQITTIPGTATVRVTAADGTTVLTYSILFVRGNPSTDASLSKIRIDGQDLEDFDPTTNSYSITLPCTYTGLPIVTAVTTNEFATFTVVNIAAFPGTATITVIAQDGITNQIYHVTFSKDECSSDASLKDLKVDGQTVTGFNPTTLTYEIVLNRDVTVPPTVIGTPNVEGATVEYKAATGIPGTTEVTVTASDGTTKRVYKVAFRHKSNEAGLASITITGDITITCQDAVLNYTRSGVTDTKTEPEATCIMKDVNATNVVTRQLDLAADGWCRKATFTIVVTAEDGTTIKTYTVVINYAMTGISDNLLSAEMQVYPNPSSGQFEIAYINDRSIDAMLEIKIMEITGRVVYSMNIGRGSSVTKVPIDLPDCHSGLYFIQVRCGEEKLVQRLVIN
ncbi:MAG: T9SS type A sorting domain-containing protein [Bacteroidales bacterium]|nr:T9SS type A sorting domain-containing protein [Bacteroidales bacterium]